MGSDLYLTLGRVIGSASKHDSVFGCELGRCDSLWLKRPFFRTWKRLRPTTTTHGRGIRPDVDWLVPARTRF